MKKIRLISLMTTFLVMLFSMPLSSNALEMQFEQIAQEQIDAKTNFSIKMDEKFALDLKAGDIKGFDENETNKLKEQYSFATTQAEKDEISSELAKYGIYAFDSSNDSTISPNAMVGVFPSSGSGDVTLNAPELFYESLDKTWTLTCSGTWKNDNCYPSFGIGSYVGDEDAFGVGITNIQSTYSSYVTNAYAYIEDEMGLIRKSTYNRSDGNGANGFGFRLQDELQTPPSGSGRVYVGYKWYGSCTYDYSFSSYACIATGYYVHTYSSAEISKIELGISGKTAGFSVEISNQSKSFTAFSVDKKLGIW